MPSANVSCTVTPGGGNASVSYAVSVSPIVIAAPDPLGRPDLGDGKNQFVYGAQQPDGFLYVPGAIRAVGATSAAMNWLIGSNPVVTSSDKVDLKIENTTIPNVFTHQWAVSGDVIYVNTPQDTTNPYPQYAFNRWIFKGLPSSNSSFGNHDMNLYVQGTKAQTAKIQTFFSGLASNWPGSDGTPNWYSYYEQAYPSSLVYSPSLKYGGEASVWGEYNGHGGNQIDSTEVLIGPWTYNRDRLPVFGINNQTKQIYTIGELYTDGIYRYLAVVYHELEHISLWVNNDVIIDNRDGSVPAGVIDTDRDGIPDAIEVQYNLDPEEPDTTGYYGDQANSLDEGHQDPECLCDIVALGQVVNKSNAWTMDWADFGVQYGARKQYFPYHYVPYSSFDPDSNQLPSDALTSLP